MSVNLNDNQVVTILTEGMSRGLYESLNNALPEDPAQRLKDATDLVSIAQAAHKNGNHSDNVETILFIALSDQASIPAQNSPEQNVTDAVANGNTFIAPAQPSAEVAHSESSPIQGFDITQVSDGVLEGLIIGLDKFPNNENVENERKAYLAEKERRASAKGQETPQAEAAGEAPEKAGETSSEVPAAGIPAGDQVSGGTGQQNGAAGDGTTVHAEQDSAQGEDAGAFARAQTPETSEQKKSKAKAKPVEEDGERSEIEAQLTLPIVKAHGIDITKLAEIPTDQLKFVVENPEGAPKNVSEEEGKESINMAIDEESVEAIPTTNQATGGRQVVGGIVPESTTSVQTVSKADLGIDIDDTSGANPAERDNLEGQITGPMLKAFGKGRKEIPNIGDNELKFMINNSTGKVSPEELENARALDNGTVLETDPATGAIYDSGTGEVKGYTEDNIPAQNAPGESPLTEVTLPSGQKIKIATSTIEQSLIKPDPPIEDRTIAEAAKQSAKKAQAEKEDKATEFVEAEHAKDNIILEQVDKSPGQSRAMEIIKSENFPIPPAYSDEQAPVFPIDVSIISRDELFSLHARFHAYETRMNWVLMQYEDEMNDCKKLRNYREAVVAKEIPFMGEDGKRNTNEFRDHQINGDPEVLDLGMKEHEVKKIVTDLKVLRDCFHLDCERLSRQMSKYEREIQDAPR